MKVNNGVSFKRRSFLILLITMVVFFFLGYTMSRPTNPIALILKYGHYQGNVKGFVINDSVVFQQYEGAVNQTKYLSDWHMGPRKYDIWRKIVKPNGTLMFRYSYLNPLLGDEGHLDFYVDPSHSRAWPSGSPQHLSRPERDYLIRIMKRE